MIDSTRSVFGRNYVMEPEQLGKHLRQDGAAMKTGALFVAVPNQLRGRVQRARHRGHPGPQSAEDGLALTLGAYPQYPHGCQEANIPRRITQSEHLPGERKSFP